MTRILIASAILMAALMFRTAFSHHRILSNEDDAGDAWIGKRAPELSEGEWVNSVPQKLSSLKGKVVLLEFWTYGCYNCRNTIPAINNWQKKYAGDQFEIIGVHTPEFDREKDFDNVKRAIAKFGIHYAVVTDNDYNTWEAYHQQFWPVLYLIDKKGIIRYVQIGEGNYEQTERSIRSLIAEESN